MEALRTVAASPLARKIAATLVLSATGVAFISGNEGRELKAYKDPVGVVTICDGHIKTAKMGQVATNAICDDLLKQDTAEAQVSVRMRVKVPVTQAQYDALVDFVFNKGDGNFASSTLLRKINAGDCIGAGAEFPKWDKATRWEIVPPDTKPTARVYVLRGLQVRAAKQRVMWESGCSPSGT